ncbi:AAA family ATPase, partial [Klebsiella pneumoniae]
MDNIEQLRKVATRAGKLLTSLSESIRQQKEELKLTEFYQEYSKAALYKLPKLSKGSVEYAVAEMEAGGYIFKKKPSGNTMKYAMTIQNVIDLYNHRKVPKYRDRFDKAFTIFVCNLKGGGSKGTVAKLAMRQPFVLFKGLTFQKLCLPGAFRPGDHHN